MTLRRPRDWTLPADPDASLAADAVCGASVVFVTVCSDENTLERIHQQVPGAPILSKLSFREHLAAAVAEASKPTTRPT